MLQKLQGRERAFGLVDASQRKERIHRCLPQAEAKLDHEDIFEIKQNLATM